MLRVCLSPPQEALNDKVRLLRAMLQWETDQTGVTDEVAEAASDPGVGAAVGEILVMTWPDGRLRRLPRGSTAGSLVAVKGLSARVSVNGVVVSAGALLRDGDIVSAA